MDFVRDKPVASRRGVVNVRVCVLFVRVVCMFGCGVWRKSLPSSQKPWICKATWAVTRLVARKDSTLEVVRKACTANSLHGAGNDRAQEEGKKKMRKARREAAVLE